MGQLGLSRTLSEITRYLQPPPRIFEHLYFTKTGSTIYTINAPLRVFTLAFCNSGQAQKTRMMPLPECERSVTMGPFV